jgi:LysR family transcriptional regulator, transcriptional activator of the cysJI operon
MFNFRLQVFNSVAVNLSFTKAAKELHITQPAVTNNIKELETTLGVTLFNREQNGIILTEAGKILLKYSKRMDEAYKQMEYEIGLMKNSFSGRLKIGASTTIEQYVLPPILAQFNQKHPDIEILMYNNNTMHVEKDVMQHSIDLGIIEGNTGTKEFKYIPFMDDEIVAIAHTSQPVSKKIQISLDELKKTPLVVREIGSGSLDVIMTKLRKQKINYKDLNIKAYLGSTESIKTFLASTNYISFVSIHAVKKEIAQGEFQIIDVDNLEITRTFHFIYPQGQQNGLVDKFIEFCLNHRK